MKEDEMHWKLFWHPVNPCTLPMFLVRILYIASVCEVIKSNFAVDFLFYLYFSLLLIVFHWIRFHWYSWYWGIFFLGHNQTVELCNVMGWCGQLTSHKKDFWHLILPFLRVRLSKWRFCRLFQGLKTRSRNHFFLKLVFWWQMSYSSLLKQNHLYCEWRFQLSPRIR